VRPNVEQKLDVVARSKQTGLSTQRLPGIETLEQLPFLLFGEVVEVGHGEHGGIERVLQGFGKFAELHAGDVDLMLGVVGFVMVFHRGKLGQSELVLKVLSHGGKSLLPVHDTVQSVLALRGTLGEDGRDRIAENHALNESGFPLALPYIATLDDMLKVNLAIDNHVLELFGTPRDTSLFETHCKILLILFDGESIKELFIEGLIDSQLHIGTVVSLRNRNRSRNRLGGGSHDTEGTQESGVNRFHLGIRTTPYEVLQPLLGNGLHILAHGRRRNLAENRDMSWKGLLVLRSEEHDLHIRRELVALVIGDDNSGAASCGFGADNGLCPGHEPNVSSEIIGIVVVHDVLLSLRPTRGRRF